MFGVERCISKGQLVRFKDMVVEGHANYLEFLEIELARDMFCSAKHRFEALFTKWTQVSHITHVPQNLHR